MKRASLFLLVLGLVTGATPEVIHNAGKPPQKGSQPQYKLTADWQVIALDPVQLASKSQATFARLKNVHMGATLDIQSPLAPPVNMGQGHMDLNSYVWGPKRFRLCYFVYSPKTSTHFMVPSIENLGCDQGREHKAGEFASYLGKVNPRDPGFNIASDPAFVEAWPKNFPKFLMSSLLGGNTTFVRYVSLLKRGVGGYRVLVQGRQVRDKGKVHVEYQIVADRGALKARPASHVEITFMDFPSLPVVILTTVKPAYRLEWHGVWYNNSKAMPKSVLDFGGKN